MQKNIFTSMKSEKTQCLKKKNKQNKRVKVTEEWYHKYRY